jgi:twitching motility protein PilT
VLDLDQLLRFAVEQGASDAHVKVGSRPRLRVDGRLREAPFDTVEPQDTEQAVRAMAPALRMHDLETMGEADFMYGIAGLGRFRVSAFRQRGWVGLVLRRVLPGIPGFEALTLPPTVRTLTEHTQGVVLVAGLAGSGKTATLAAMVDHVNTTRECHIVTVEDPIEVLHPDKRSLVDQREVGTDTSTGHSALLHALRQDPDVLMLSELRDGDTAWAALQAAEAGHLVFSSLPTTSVVDTVERFVEMFEPHRQAVARTMLASALRGIVAQRLLPRARGRGRVPAVEILVANSRVTERIADPGLVHELTREMAQGDLYGMQTFDQSLVQLYRSGLIGRDDAVAHAAESSELRYELDRSDLDRDPPVPPEGARHEPGGPLPKRVPAVGVPINPLR